MTLLTVSGAVFSVVGVELDVIVRASPGAIAICRSGYSELHHIRTEVLLVDVQLEVVLHRR